MRALNRKTSSQTKKARTIELWISIGICFLIQLIGVRTLLPLYQQYFPSFPWILISFSMTSLAFIIPSIYLAIIYGWPNRSCFTIRIQDLMILIAGVLFLFLAAAVYILKYGVRISPGFSNLISSLDTFEYLAVVLIIIILVPLFEEIFFRKYVLELLKSRYRLSVSIILTVLIETLLHLGYSGGQLIIVFIYSIGLTIAYLKSSLGTVIILHCMINILFSFP